MVYISKLKARSMQYPNPNLQTIEMSKKYTLEDAKKWLRKHGFLYQNWRETKNYWRFIQNSVIIGSKFYSDKLNDNIIFVYQKY